MSRAIYRRGDQARGGDLRRRRDERRRHGLHGAVSLAGETVEVFRLLKAWRETGPCHHGSGENTCGNTGSKSSPLRAHDDDLFGARRGREKAQSMVVVYDSEEIFGRQRPRRRRGPEWPLIATSASLRKDSNHLARLFLARP